MTILGRTVEHLGTQMYKHRAPALAELVANSWDAGAESVWLTVPEEGAYNQASSSIEILDSGEGMSPKAVENQYLVVGRNRRSELGAESHGRRVMGRKGIGKLAGFGLAAKVTVTTWTSTSEKAVQFDMSLNELKTKAGSSADIKFPWSEVDKKESWPESGTLIRLGDLKHSSPIELDSLRETLARRFSRTTRGEMKLLLNGVELEEPNIETFFKSPKEKEFETEKLPGGQEVKFRYSFSKKPIRSKELQGFVIYTNERTSQAPPYFFGVESTASSQHSTRYVTGEIVADFLDSGTDDESDLVSTDRQELDWEKDELKELKEWGEKLSRRVLIECGTMMGQELDDWVLADPEFSRRLEILERPSRIEISKFLKVLGQRSTKDETRTHSLADSLIRAYEFRNFHDVIDEIESASTDPAELEGILGKLHDWQVLEGRAILEIVQGRLSIIRKFEKMLVNNAPETASKKTDDNLHDLLAEYPWIFNPEWQVFTEEKTISKQLREWGERDCPEEMANKRIDFLAFGRDDGELIIIEIKRSGHAVELDEVQRLERYQAALMKTHPNCKMMLVYGGTVNIPEKKWNDLKEDPGFEAITWDAIFSRASRFYSHYEAILSGDASGEGFRSKTVEVARTRKILDSSSSHRSKEDRKRGIGDINP